jgi:hypothetical protein
MISAQIFETLFVYGLWFKFQYYAYSNYKNSGIKYYI